MPTSTTSRELLKKTEDAYLKLAGELEQIAQTVGRIDGSYINTDLIHWLVTERRRLQLFPQILRRRLGE